MKFNNMRRAVPVLLVLTMLAVGCGRSGDTLTFAERRVEVAAIAYDLDLIVDYDEPMVRGSADITFRNISDRTIGSIPLQLYRMMKITGTTDTSGGPVRFTQRIVPYEDWEQLHVNFIEVDLSGQLRPGREESLTFTWEGYLYGYTEAMMYVKDHVDPAYTVLRDETFPFPVVGYPCWEANRKAGFPEYSYEVRVTVPDSLVVANGGELLGIDRANGRATYRYRNIKPAWRLDIAIAPYETIRSGGLTVFHFREDGHGGSIIAGAFQRAVDLYTDWFGPLREFGGFSIIEVPDGYGSQADVTCILLQAGGFRNLDDLDQLYHEASHLWNVTPTDLPSPRWNEGLATFHQVLLVDEFRGDGELTEVERLARRMRERLLSRFESDPRLAKIPMNDYGKEDITDLSYRVGMLMFGALYHLMGLEDLNRLIGEYYERYRASGASTSEFVALAGEISPFELEPFFRDWLYTADYTRFLDTDLTLTGIAETYR